MVLHERLPRRIRVMVFNLNPPLVAGTLMVLLMMSALIAAPLLTDQDPLRMRVNTPGISQPGFPAPPGSPGFPLGTDVQGRDMFSRLLYGGRYTMLICLIAALARVCIGTLVGMIAGWYPASARVLNSLISAWSAIPPLFFAMFMRLLLALAVFGIARAGPKNLDAVIKDAVVFTIIIGLTGWPEIAVRCQAAVLGMRSLPFVEAAYVVGLRRAAVLWRHILPNLRGLLAAESANAIAGALLLLAELGFFQIFVGGSTEDINSSSFLAPIYSEWGSLIALSLRQRNQGYWILIEPLLAFTLAIVAFNLLAEGLRRRR